MSNYDLEMFRNMPTMIRTTQCACGYRFQVVLYNLNVGTNPYLFPPVALKDEQVTCPNCRAVFMVAGIAE